MLIEDDKLMICQTLDNCWYFNLTKQNMCQEIFQTYNRVWNRVHSATSSNEDNPSDNVKFRKVLEEILVGKKLTNFISSSALTDLSKVLPLIHNDQFVSTRYNEPFSLTGPQQLSEEDSLSATQAHSEFNDYLSRVRAGTNSKNKKKFISKLSRLLYIVRSNIAHGSKLQYQGSQRNEQICEVTYRVLLDLSNLILENGLFKIAAYGELKRGGHLHSPLVVENGGTFIVSAEVVGGVLETDNSVVFTPHSEFERTTVEILEFNNSESLYVIDLVECMPRTLVPFYLDGVLGGFSWIYQRFMQIEDYKGPVSPFDREKAIRDRCMTFLHTLISLRHIYSQRMTVSEQHRKKFFGKITFEIGHLINYQYEKSGSTLVHPFAPNMISLIDEIGKSFNLIYNRSDRNYPYSGEINSAIYEDCELNKKFYNRFEANTEDETAQKMYTHLVNEIIYFIALWICEKSGDHDALMWEELNPQNHQMH